MFAKQVHDPAPMVTIIIGTDVSRVCLQTDNKWEFWGCGDSLAQHFNAKLPGGTTSLPSTTRSFSLSLSPFFYFFISFYWRGSLYVCSSLFFNMYNDMTRNKWWSLSESFSTSRTKPAWPAETQKHMYTALIQWLAYERLNCHWTRSTPHAPCMHSTRSVCEVQGSNYTYTGYRGHCLPLLGLRLDAFWPLSIFRAFFITSWPCCHVVTLPSGLSAPKTKILIRTLVQ